MRVKDESEKASLKHNIQKTRIMVSGPITSWQIDGGVEMEIATIIFPLVHSISQAFMVCFMVVVRRQSELKRAQRAESQQP